MIVCLSNSSNIISTCLCHTGQTVSESNKSTPLVGGILSLIIILVVGVCAVSNILLIVKIRNLNAKL